ncbi:MAG: hypothetical protein AB7F09_11130 [Parvibaculaceae bacterium]
MTRKMEARTKVSRFKLFDIMTDEFVVSSRYATGQAIAEIGGRAIPGTEIEIDSADLDENGMTARKFEPR